MPSNLFIKILIDLLMTKILTYIVRTIRHRTLQIEGVNSMPVQTCTLPPLFTLEDLPKAGFSCTVLHMLNERLSCFIHRF